MARDHRTYEAISRRGIYTVTTSIDVEGDLTRDELELTELAQMGNVRVVNLLFPKVDDVVEATIACSQYVELAHQLGVIRFDCNLPDGHDGPHNGGGCTWPAAEAVTPPW